MGGEELTDSGYGVIRNYEAQFTPTLMCELKTLQTH